MSNSKIKQLAAQYPDRWERDGDGNIVCAKCRMGDRLILNGTRRTASGQYPQILCKRCNSSSTGRRRGRPREKGVGDSAIRMRKHREQKKSNQ